MRIARVAPLRSSVVIGVTFATVIVLSGCKDDSEAEARRYQGARGAFTASTRSDSRRLASTVAAPYLDRLAADDSAPEPGIVQQFQSQYAEFNEAYCRELKAIGTVVTAGSRGLSAQRLDETRTAARELVFDAMASALLQGALDAPSERRDKLFDGLAIQAKADDGTKLSGIAALQEAGLVDLNGRFTFPERGTRQYEEYKTWFDDAEGLASRIDLLIKPTRIKIDECLPPQ